VPDFRDHLPLKKRLPCLCGSGLRYGNCCKASMERFFPAGARAPVGHPRLPESSSPWRTRLLSARRYFSWYLVCFLARSLPDSLAGRPLVQPILEEFRALRDLLELRLSIYHQVEDWKAFERVLCNVEGAVPGPQWKEIILYLRTAATLGATSWDEEQGRRVLGVPAPDKVHFWESLALYLDLAGDAVPLGEMVRVCEKILSLTDRAVVVLQYTTLISLWYGLHGASDPAVEVRKTHALDRFVEVWEPPGDLFERTRLLLLVGECIREGILEFEHPHVHLCRQIVNMTRAACVAAGEEGAGSISFEVAEFFRSLQEWDEAISLYDCVTHPKDLPAAAVLSAECHIYAGRPAVAYQALGEMEFDSLPPAVQYDHTIATAMLADSGVLSESDLGVVKARLAEAVAPFPELREMLGIVRRALEERSRKQLELELETLKRGLQARSEQSHHGPQGPQSIAAALSAFRDLAPEEQVCARPRPMPLDATVADMVFSASARVLDGRLWTGVAGRSKENAFTRIVADLIEQRVMDWGWTVDYQSHGGRSGGQGGDHGIRDFVVRKVGGAPIVAFEALRIQSFATAGQADLGEHMARLLDRYDDVGVPVAVVAVYLEMADFASFVERYVSVFPGLVVNSGIRCSEPVVPEQWEAKGWVRRGIQVRRSTIEFKGGAQTLVHLLIHWR